MSESANALEYLSLAGFEVQEQIDALPSVLNAAAASNIDLASSADIVSNIMSGFQISAENTEQAVDVLVKTFTTANTDLPQLGEAFKYVAPIANSLGLEITEVAAAIGILSDNGIQGGQAGTVLRQALLSLTDPTGQTKDAMEDLNIEILDAEGNMKPLPELIGHISDRMDGMTDAQKTAAASQLVGSQAASGFIALLEEGEESLQNYTKELENSGGTAQEIADIQNNNLNGAFNEFKSVLEELGIEIGNEFLPLFTDIVRKGSDVIRSINEMDTSTIKAGLAFAGTAAAIALTVSTIGKLVLAVRGLMASMGPAGWLITGLSIVGGLIAAANVDTEEAIEVNLDHARSLDEESSALKTQIDRFDELQKKNKLSNDELAEFVDLQSRISLETDPDKIDKLQKRFTELLEKSGFTNKEMSEFLGLNDEIVQKVPDSNKVLTDQGNIILENTDAAKAYNEQLYKELELELRKQANEASKQLQENIQLRTDALKEQNNLAEDFIEKQREIEVQEMQIASEELKLQKAREEGNKSVIKYAEQRVEEEENALNVLENQALEISGQIIEQEELINDIELQILKGQEAYEELINYRLEQVEITAEKGKEIEAIEKAIEKTKDLQKEAREKYTIDGEITDEGREQLDLLAERLSELQSTKSEVNNLKEEQNRLTDSIDDSVGVAKDLNYEMARDIEKHLEQTGYSIEDAEDLNRELGLDQFKKITVDDDGTAQDVHNRATAPGTKHVTIWESVRRFSENRHQGGIIGTQSRGNLLPNLHVGGIADDAANNIVRNMQNTPLHNEIDVRLLRNEMVLTEGQQANLWRLVENNSGTRSRDDSEYWLQAIQLLSEIARSTEEGKYTELLLSERYFGSRLEPIITEIQQRKNNPRRAGRVDR